MAFWKRRNKGDDPEPTVSQESAGLLDRLRDSGVELVQVVGPHDTDAGDGHWVGAVLRLGVEHDSFPPVEHALSLGLLSPGSKNQLVPFDPAGVSDEKRADAMACTQFALEESEKRPDGAMSALLAPEPDFTEDNSVEALRRKFVRVYEAARDADLRGEHDVVLQKAQAAVSLLREADLYGERQPLVETALLARIQTIHSRNAE